MVINNNFFPPSLNENRKGISSTFTWINLFDTGSKYIAENLSEQLLAMPEKRKTGHKIAIFEATLLELVLLNFSLKYNRFLPQKLWRPLPLQMINNNFLSYALFISFKGSIDKQSTWLQIIKLCKFYWLEFRVCRQVCHFCFRS